MRCALRRAQIGSRGCPMELITASIHKAEKTCDLYSSAHRADSGFHCHCAIISCRKPARFARCSAEQNRAGQGRAGQGRSEQLYQMCNMDEEYHCITIIKSLALNAVELSRGKREERREKRSGVQSYPSRPLRVVRNPFPSRLRYRDSLELSRYSPCSGLCRRR